MDSSQEEAFKPPYGSFRTFWAFVASLREKPLPPRIDRSMLDSKSGTDQLAILSALKAFVLVAGEDQRVRPSLPALVKADAEGRKPLLAEMLHRWYPRQIAISDEHGTEKMLLESFEKDFDLTGDTRRKAATWFLHAAHESGVPMSSHFPKLRPGQGGASPPRPRRVPKKKSSPNLPAASGDVKNTGAGGDDYTVKLQAGGTVTLRVNVGHFALSRHKQDREFVQGLIDALTAYESSPDDKGGES